MLFDQKQLACLHKTNTVVTSPLCISEAIRSIWGFPPVPVAGPSSKFKQYLRARHCLIPQQAHALLRQIYGFDTIADADTLGLQEHLNELTGNKARGGLSGQQMAMYGEAVANLAK